ncbi:MAG TPA: CsgG/HfaB family protein [Candidatus Edwardsbacteria bacterium]|nr:CsgG/HfaB family protein [Candidatus Edwardsbacteria bacterium]
MTALAVAGKKPPAGTAAAKGNAPGAAVQTAPTTPQKVPTIAVMTLENASGKPDDEWMGIGFAETITAKLARLRNIRVVERRQIEKATKEIALSQSGAVDPRSVVSAGKLLAANYLLIGSVQKLEAGAKSQLMVNTRVMNTESGELFQTVTERGPYEGIFDLQDKLALEVAAALAVPVSLDEKQALRRDETDSRGAYEFFWMGMAATDIAYKEQMYRKAIELDPKYVNALANLASVLMVENIGQPLPDFAEAKRLAQQAIALDSLVSEPHWILGSIYRREGDKQLAIKELEAHLKLDPNSQYKDLVRKQLEKLRK